MRESRGWQGSGGTDRRHAGGTERENGIPFVAQYIPIPWRGKGGRKKRKEEKKGRARGGEENNFGDIRILRILSRFARGVEYVPSKFQIVSISGVKSGVQPRVGHVCELRTFFTSNANKKGGRKRERRRCAAKHTRGERVCVRARARS